MLQLQVNLLFHDNELIFDGIKPHRIGVIPEILEFGLLFTLEHNLLLDTLDLLNTELAF